MEQLSIPTYHHIYLHYVEAIYDLWLSRISSLPALTLTLTLDNFDSLPVDMPTRFFAFLYLIQLARATSTNSTTTGCRSCDATSCNYRSVWSLLASCGLTLLICVWHAIHPAVPLPHYRWIHGILYQLTLMLVAFFTPEIMIATAFAEWHEAKQITKRVHSTFPID